MPTQEGKISDRFQTLLSEFVGELYRNNGEWKFNAIGGGFQGGLASLCSHYGIDVM